MVVSVSRDGTVHFWDLIERTLTREVTLPSLPLRAAFSRNTGLLAVALEPLLSRLANRVTRGMK